MACDNCNGLEGFWCPVCRPKGIDTRDIHARAPIDRIKALEAEVERLTRARQTMEDLYNEIENELDDQIGGRERLAEEASRLRAENARLTSELDAAKARIAALTSPDSPVREDE